MVVEEEWKRGRNCQPIY